MCNDHAQPPMIEEVFRRIGCNGWYLNIDIANAFCKIPLERESQQFTGFLFNGQMYVFKRIPFVRKTAGVSFIRAMAKALDPKAEEYMIVYLNNILIASKNLEEHIEHLRYVISKLNKAGF